MKKGFYQVKAPPPLAGKIKTTVFWEAPGVIHAYSLITATYYVHLLDRLKADLKKKRPHLAKKKVLFHHDKATADTSAIATIKLVKFHYEFLPDLLYYRDLFPCHSFLFPTIKRLLAEKMDGSKVKVIAAAEEYFADQ